MASFATLHASLIINAFLLLRQASIFYFTKKVSSYLLSNASKEDGMQFADTAAILIKFHTHKDSCEEKVAKFLNSSHKRNYPTI